MKKVLVVGGAGYIGSHQVLDLLEAGYHVHVLDNFIKGHRSFVEGIEFTEGDLGDGQLLDQLFSEHQFEAVFHFAAYSFVGESVTDPAKYYANNVAATLTLLQKMLDHKILKFIYSSTCATYGFCETMPISEQEKQSPINPYGWSKWMVEQVLRDYDRAYGMKSVMFRYFNAAGADIKMRRGEKHDPETHLIPLVLAAAVGRNPSFTIFGDDYPTEDGTCIRDYIHVNDLSQAHILGLEYLMKGKPSEVFNLGNGNGFSVRQVVETCEKVTGQKVSYKMGKRREGDPPVLVGDSNKARQVLGWKPQYDDLEAIITSAWNWCKKEWQI